MSEVLPPVIVGAGPAGIRAAEKLVAAGLRPVVVDEAARWGGQIYRQPPDGGFTRPKKALYGFEAGKADAVHRAMAAIRDRVAVHRANLLVDAAPVGPATCHAVLCRNVLIYLRRDRIGACLARVAAALVPGGSLLIGGSESLYGVEHPFAVERVGGVFVHRRVPGLPTPAPHTPARPAVVARPAGAA